MNELLDIIIKATTSVFGISEEDFLQGSRNKDIVFARRAAAWLCKREGIPARMLSERCGVSRWSINRMQTETRVSQDKFFHSKVEQLEKEISTLKARRK